MKRVCGCTCIVFQNKVVFIVCVYISVSEGLSSVATAGISAGVVGGTLFFGGLLALLVLGLCLCLRRGNEKNGNLALSDMSICLCLRRKSDSNDNSENGQVTHCWLIAVEPV